jgi:protocatechuate 3,4-dioxygenase beta subunit
MRGAIMLLLVVLCAPMLAQTTGFTLVQYTAPRYTAPKDAPSSVVIAGKDEPGERLVVTGRALEGTKPVAGVSLHVFHADAKGLCATDTTDVWHAEFNPRLHGSLRTDADGRYQYETIRPGSYGNPPGASHVHYVVKKIGYRPLLIALEFEDDPIIAGQGGPVKARMLLQESEAFRNGPCKSRPDCVLIQAVTRDAQRVSHVVRDIQMVRQ